MKLVRVLARLVAKLQIQELPPCENSRHPFPLLNVCIYSPFFSNFKLNSISTVVVDKESRTVQIIDVLSTVPTVRFEF